MGCTTFHSSNTSKSTTLPGMFIRALASLALLLQARSEWVEISQQQYRKPTRPAHHAFLEPAATQPGRIYMSDTSATPHWSTGNVIRVAAGVGRVEHVTKPGVAKTATVNGRPDHKAGHTFKEATAHISIGETPESFMKERPSEKIGGRPARKPEDRIVTERSSSKRSYGTTAPPERVTENTDGVLRRKDYRSTRKPISNGPDDNVTGRPSSKPNYESSRSPEGVTEPISFVRRHDIMRQPDKQSILGTRRPTVFTSTIDPNRATRIPNRIYINGNKASSSKVPSVDEYFVTEKPNSTTENAKKSTATINQRIDSYATRHQHRNEASNDNLNNGYEYFVTEKSQMGTETTKPVITTTRRMNNYVTRNPYEDLNFIEQRPFKTKSNEHKYEETTTRVNFFRKPEDVTSEPTIVPNEVSLDSSDLDIRRIDIASIVDPDIPDFITKQELIYDENDDGGKHLYIEHEDAVSNTPDTPQTNLISAIENDEFSSESTVTSEESYHQDHVGDTMHGDEFERPVVEGKKPNPIENVVKLMKVVSETISKNTRRGITSKVRYLQDLRDTIMMNIEHRIDDAWPEDDAAEGAGGKRAGRSAREARGHVDFPSSEGALMSISFLTFAVFLIKLIMQVVYRYRNQTMMVTPTVFAVSRAADAVAARSGT